MNSPVDDFIERSFANNVWFPRVEFDPERPSVCPFGSIASDGMVRWRPVRREDHDTKVEALKSVEAKQDFVDLASEFVGGYWSSTLECRFGYQYLTLDCGAWNEDDFNKKQASLLTHFETRKAANLPPSLPLGWSTGSQSYLGLNLQTGEVCIEELDGSNPLQKLCASLDDFLAGLHCVRVTDGIGAGYFE